LYRNSLALLILFLVILSLIPKIENPVNINVEELILQQEDFGKEILYQRFQTRMCGKDFKLMDYPIGEFGARIDVNFFERTGFICSAAIEADLGDHKVASIALLFKNCSGAKAAYNEIISFLSYRRTYDSYPYLWVPRWDNVEDIINHFIIALYNNHPTKLNHFGEEGAYFYDPLNDFHYIIFRSGRLVLMVGSTASKEKAFEYAGILEHKLIKFQPTG